MAGDHDSTDAEDHAVVAELRDVLAHERQATVKLRANSGNVPSLVAALALDIKRQVETPLT